MPTLDPAQNLIANHVDGALLAIAPPGSGKTTALVERAIRLIRSGVAPENILLLTFSRKAADEMSERILRLTQSPPVTGTFHSFGLLVIRRDPEKCGRQRGVKVILGRDEWQMFTNVCKENNITDHADIKYFLKMYRACRSTLRVASNEGLSSHIQEYMNQTDYVVENTSIAVNFAVSLFGQYEQAKIRDNVVDFDDCISLPISAFRRYPQMAEHYSRTYQYIMIDEYQDIDQNQYDLVDSFCLHNNIAAIGDDDQSIFAFRGSDPELMNAFTEQYGAAIVQLEKNYRSNPHIVALAEKLINQNTKRHRKQFYSMKTDDFNEPLRFMSKDHLEHASTLLKNIAQDIQAGIPLKDIAILFRNNYMQNYLIKTLSQHKLPYKILGGSNRDPSEEVVTYLAVIRLLLDSNDYSAFVHIGNLLNIPRIQLKKAVQYCKKSNGEVNVWDSCARLRKINMSSFKDQMTSMLGLLSEVSPEDSFQWMRNHRLFQQWMDTLRKRNSSGENDAVLADRQTDLLDLEQDKILKFIQRSVNQDLDDFEIYYGLCDLHFLDGDVDLGDKDAITLGTMHRSKGMEWVSVHVVGFSETIVPSYTKSRPLTQRALDEERRLAYVALTRAQSHLRVYHSNSVDAGSFITGGLEPSRFFTEMTAL